jgi:prepilin-type N-terminal cleavage/methylation domain-containing protein
MGSNLRFKGFSLIEVLIATAVLSLIIGICSLSFSIFSRGWDAQRLSSDGSLKKFQVMDLTANAIRGALPWAIRARTGEAGFYFLGRDEGVTFVTANPIFVAGSPAIVRIFRESVGDQRWRLVYEEATLNKVGLRTIDQAVTFTNRVVVLDEMSEIGFRYFGLGLEKNGSDSDDQDVYERPRWFSEYDGMKVYRHPILISLTLNGSEILFDMPNREDVISGVIAEGY